MTGAREGGAAVAVTAPPFFAGVPACPIGPFTHRAARVPRKRATSLASGTADASGAADARVDTTKGDASVRSRPSTAEGSATGGERNRDCAIGAESGGALEGRDGLTDEGDS